MYCLRSSTRTHRACSLARWSACGNVRRTPGRFRRPGIRSARTRSRRRRTGSALTPPWRLGPGASGPARSGRRTASGSSRRAGRLPGKGRWCSARPRLGPRTPPTATSESAARAPRPPAAAARAHAPSAQPRSASAPSSRGL